MEGSDSSSRRGRAGFHFRRELAEYEQGNRPRVSVRLSPLLVAAIFVAAFVVLAPCSSSSSSVPVAPGIKGFEKTAADKDCHQGKCKCCAAGKCRCSKHCKDECNRALLRGSSQLPSPNPSKGTFAPPPKTASAPPPPASPPPPRPPPPPASSAPSPHPGTRKLAVTTGWSFLCFALLLQVALGGFLVYRRWELQRLGLWKN